MTLIFFGLAILNALDGFRILVSSKSAIHEIEGLVMLLIAAIFLSACGIIRAIEKSQIVNLTDVVK